MACGGCKKLILLLVWLSAVPLFARPAPELTPPEREGVTVHYYRYRGDYEGWNLWVWGEGQAYAIDFGGLDAEGFASARVPTDWLQGEGFGFIVRHSTQNNDWAEKDTDKDRYFVLKNKELWILQNEEKVFTEKPEIPGPIILYAVADSKNIIRLALIQAPDTYDTFAVFDSEGNKLEGAAEQGQSEDEVVLTLDKPLEDPSVLLTVRDEAGVFSPKNVEMGGILDAYYYDGEDLGLTYSPSASQFKVWAPAAKMVYVAIVRDGKAPDDKSKELVTCFPMEKDKASGVWGVILEGDFKGLFYMYFTILADGTAVYVPDPYAKAVSANGECMAIVDLAESNPKVWTNDKPKFGAFQDAVIYELHIRDFSIDENSGMINKGKFLAFTETGTVNREGTPTGLAHLKALGLTHVHLLPSFDYASVDERTSASFNWGYDPQNYNVPEGSYSTKPQEPLARINEFKQMVQALHDAGIRVVMDVVYNHTFKVDGGPFAITGTYFYRIDRHGKLSNGSGCGNEVASEKPMVRKFIRDSVLYWAREYHVDGFRFDLMGLIDKETMTLLTRELREKLDPSILIYGEPWTAGWTPLPKDEQTLVGAQKGLGFAVFNDRLRNALKGDSDGALKGFASGAAENEEGIALGIAGSIDDFTEQADESINYVTAHDNLNLWDKFALSFGSKHLDTSPYELITGELFANNAVRASLLSKAVIFTAQGIPFFQAGDEFLRSKYGDPNSYASPDAVNKIRWENASKFSEITAYYKGLIKLRREHPAFRLNTRTDIEKHLEIIQASKGLVSFVLKDHAGGDSWEHIFVVFNSSEKAHTVALPLLASKWLQVLDDKRAGVEVLGECSASVNIPALSAAVFISG